MKLRIRGIILPMVAALVVVMMIVASESSGQKLTSKVNTSGEQIPDDLRSTPQLSSRLQSLLDGLVNEQGNVRNGVLLVQGPGFKWKGASGMAFPDSGLSMLPDDQFNIDSIAKIMTATIVLKLVENEKLELDDKIGVYLPDSLMEGLHVYEGRSCGEEITVRHLLSHTSGIPDDWASPKFFELIMADLQKRWTPEETVEFVKQNCEPHFAPGDGWRYSDTGYNLLGLIIERVTGRELHVVYRDLLLDPLGMNRTYRPSHEEAPPSPLGRGPSRRYLDDIECTLLPAVMTADWAGGGMISTTEDLNRFIRAFIRKKIFKGPKTRDEMFRWVKSGPFHGYGFGISRVLFNESEDPEHAGLGEIWGHAGSSYCFMFYWPREDVTIIGTLNQINCEMDRYDILASIMRAILETK
jgi:D-alanyl-D-alanine carboxypeptidase